MRPNSSGRPLTTLTAVIVLLSCFSGIAALRLPRVFSSHMVLQQEKPIAVWGWAEPNEKITVRLSTATQETTANAKGEWKLSLPTMKAGGPFVMTVSGAEEVKFNDV